MAHYRPATPMVSGGESKGWNQLPAHRGWGFTSTTRAAATSTDGQGPSTIYPNSRLILEYKPGQTVIHFQGAQAAKFWACMGELDSDTLQSSYTGEAHRGTLEQCQNDSADGEPESLFIVDSESCWSKEQGGEPSETQIPLDRYLVPEQVLFYDEVVLCEHRDSTCHSCIKVKIRVMPNRFLVLLRTLQVNPATGDMRLVDTRLAHEFGEQLVLADTEVRRGRITAEDVIPPGVNPEDVMYTQTSPVWRQNLVIRLDE